LSRKNDASIKKRLKTKGSVRKGRAHQKSRSSIREKILK